VVVGDPLEVIPGGGGRNLSKCELLFEVEFVLGTKIGEKSLIPYEVQLPEKLKLNESFGLPLSCKT
jgi:hypothetical protein